MTPTEILETLRQQGVELSVSGQQLRYRAPRGALTPEMLSALRKHKPALLGLLSEGMGCTVDPSIQEQVEALIASVTRCRPCGRIAWRRSSGGGWTCGICHPKEGQETVAKGPPQLDSTAS